MTLTYFMNITPDRYDYAPIFLFKTGSVIFGHMLVEGIFFWRHLFP